MSWYESSPAPTTWLKTKLTDLLQIFESVCNPRVRVGSWLARITRAYDSKIGIESFKVKNLAKLPEFVHQPEANMSEIRSTYHQLTIDLLEVRQKLATFSHEPSLKTIHAQFQGAYSVLLTFANILNIILRSFGAGGSHLIEESSMIVEEVIPLAQHGLQYRPLGSSFMPMCLASTWAATKEVSKRAELEEILAAYQSDFATAKWLETAHTLEVYLSKDRLPLKNPLYGGPSFK